MRMLPERRALFLGAHGVYGLAGSKNSMANEKSKWRIAHVSMHAPKLYTALAIPYSLKERRLECLLGFSPVRC